jgi:hypothetical protein
MATATTAPVIRKQAAKDYIVHAAKVNLLSKGKAATVLSVPYG